MTIIDREGNAHDTRGQFAGRENSAPSASLAAPPEPQRRTKRWLVAGGAVAVTGIITAGFLLGGASGSSQGTDHTPGSSSSSQVVTDDVPATELTSEAVVGGIDLSSLSGTQLSRSGEGFTGGAVSVRAITRDEATAMGYRSAATDGAVVLVTFELLAKNGSRSAMIDVPYLFQPDDDGDGEVSGGPMSFTADKSSNTAAVYGSGDTRFAYDQFPMTTSVVAP